MELVRYLVIVMQRVTRKLATIMQDGFRCTGRVDGRRITSVVDYRSGDTPWFSTFDPATARGLQLKMAIDKGQTIPVDDLLPFKGELVDYYFDTQEITVRDQPEIIVALRSIMVLNDGRLVESFDAGVLRGLRAVQVETQGLKIGVPLRIRLHRVTRDYGRTDVTLIYYLPKNQEW